jgi:hypothetical protein
VRAVIRLPINEDEQQANASDLYRLLRARRERPRCRAAERDNKFSPPNVDCHATLPRGHAMETITHPVMLRCGISTRLTPLRVIFNRGNRAWQAG